MMKNAGLKKRKKRTRTFSKSTSLKLEMFR